MALTFPDRSTALRALTGRTAVMLAALVLPLAAGHAQTSPIAITVDASANRHPISPLIYGLNFGTADALRDLRAPINRSGGNSASTYNWRLNARNAGKDWYFESLPCDPQSINDQFGSSFITLTRAAGATPMITLSMLGWQARLGPDHGRLASFAITKYGPQQDNDASGFYDAGNGIAANGTPITGNDPHDAQTPASLTDEQARLRDLVRQFGAGGLPYIILDNEPSMWQVIHRDVRPTGAHADEIAKKIIAYSRAVKAIAPTTKVVAPEEWGWLGYHYSGFDQQYGNTNGLDHTPDRTGITQGMDYVPWLLTQWKAAGHPVDVFSLHFYPQDGVYSDSDTREVELARNRSTRDLWDPSYTDPSWIKSVVALIPLMRKWVNQYYYPGTPIAITEYNWGGEKLMNGATAQADVLGIFGREGLDIATRWATPDATTPVYKAMKLYRNYDGKGSAFGNTSIGAAVPDPDTVSAFAALRDTDGAATVMVINKQLEASAAVTITLAHLPDHGAVETWQLADNALTRLPDTHYANGALGATLPRQSVTLFILHNAGHG
ncbi:MAG: glycoside hydrolase family 44 protein [Acetobacter sp.]|uniref:glycoside hydrolase family 44 protein n=1 Tax=Acetobacter sp. TaxID=440 RepID=UPI0039ECE6C7